MIVIIIFLPLLLLPVAALLAGHLAFLATGSRGIRIAMVVLVLCAPFWDLIPGWLAYRQAVQDLGGQRIHRRVVTDGYLDLTQIDAFKAWRTLNASGFRFIEIKRTVPAQFDPLRSLEQRPGYYVYRRYELGSAECAETDAILRNSIQRLDKYCFSVTWHATPVSRYAYEFHSRKPLEGYSWPRPVLASWQHVRDLETGDITAESYSIEYTPWFWTLQFFPWTYDQDETGQPFHFDLYGVLMPPTNDSKVTPDA